MKKLLKIFWMPVLLFVFNELPFMQYFYDTYPRIDHIMHALGGFAIAFMFYTYITEMRVMWWKHVPPTWRFFLVVSIAMLFGVAWEWYEFLHDYFFGTHFQLNNSDTMFDLLFDWIGSIVFSIKILFFERK